MCDNFPDYMIPEATTESYVPAAGYADGGAIGNTDGLAIIGRTVHDLRGIRYSDGVGGNAPAPAAPAGEAPNAATIVNTAAPAASSAPAPLAGPNPSAPGTGAPSAPATPAAGTQPPAPDPNAGDASLEGDLEGGIKFVDLDERTQRSVRNLRAEAKNTRIAGEKAQKELLDKVSVALGIKASDAPADPVALAASVTQATEQLTTAQRENAVLRVAPSLNLNGDRLLDSRAFTTALAGTNPDDPAAIRAVLTQFTANRATEFALTTAPAGSGTGGAGTGGTRQAAQPGTLLDAIAQSVAQHGPQPTT